MEIKYGPVGDNNGDIMWDTTSWDWFYGYLIKDNDNTGEFLG